MTRVRRVDEAIVADIFVRFGHSAAWREDTTAYIPWRAEQVWDTSGRRSTDWTIGRSGPPCTCEASSPLAHKSLIFFSGKKALSNNFKTKRRTREHNEG